jgi:hypothetical protein
MTPALSNTPEFLEGFIETCFNKGFTEDQTAEMLKRARFSDMMNSKDPMFTEGFQSTLCKSAAPVKSLLNIPVTWKGLGGLGALGAGAALPMMARPTPFDADENVLSGAAKGIGIGGLLGLGLGGLKGGFRGSSTPGVSNFRKFLQEANPYPRWVDPATGIKTPGRVTNLFGPLSAMGKAVTDPSAVKGLGRGAYYGGFAGGGLGLKDSLSNGLGGFSGLGSGSNYSPGYSGGGGTSAPSPLSGGKSDIYSVPKSLKDYYAPAAAGAGAAGVSAGAGATTGALADLKRFKDNLGQVDSRMQALQGQLKSINASDPNGMLTSYDLKRELNELSRIRDEETSRLNKALERAQEEQTRYHAAASNDFALANRGATAAQQNMGMHMNLLEGREGNSWHDLWRAPLSYLLNSEDKVRDFDAQRRMNDAIKAEAQKAMQRRLLPSE